MKTSLPGFLITDRTFASFAPHALKGQKLLAQGIALGVIAISKSPCKGKSFKIPELIKLLPLQVGCSKFV